MDEEVESNEQLNEEEARADRPTKRERRLIKKEAKLNERDSTLKKKKAKKLLYIGIGIALIVLGIWYISSKEVTPLPGERVDDQGNQHIDSINAEHIAYNTTPPTSGPHTGGLAPWGISDSQLPDESQIHNLEDGGVGVQYNCSDGCEELIEQLTDIVQNRNHIFMGPYQNMENTIALTAWGRIDSFNEFDEERIRSFIEAYRGIDHHKR